MSAPVDLPSRKSTGDSPSVTPVGSPGTRSFLVPSPVPCKRTRTYSACERAAQGPTYKGQMKSFCRERGHGFVIPEEGGDPLFCHISDIEGDYIPKAGDEVTYKRIAIPPKMEKFSAVHVTIQKLAQGEKHETWEAPVHKEDAN